MSIKRVTVNILTILVFLIVCPSVWAATYYVSGTNGSDSNPGTLNSSWKTIGKANSTLRAGDTVYIKGGTYTAQYVSPTNSGTSTQPITYSNYNGEKVTVRDASYGININGKSYINVAGIDFYNLDHFIYITSGSHNTISDCSFDQMRNYTYHGSRIFKSSQYNKILNSSFSKWGYEHKGGLFDIGDQTNSTDHSNYNLIEGNKFYHGGHHLLGVFSRYNVIRNNFLHNEKWGPSEGYRNIVTAGVYAGSNLYEKNRILFAYEEGVGLGLRSPDNIVRLNVFHNNDRAGLELLNKVASYNNKASNNTIYNNTFAHNGISDNDFDGYKSSILVVDWGDGDPVGNIIKNNILWGSKFGVPIKYSGVSTPQIVENNWEEAGDPLFTNPEGADPFNPDLPDFSLRENSPLIDTGAWLTTITTASNSGFSFQVKDAKYFMDGWGVIEGDLIQLEGQTSPVRITKVDLTNNTVTVGQSISWTQGQGVSLAYQGSAPDIGAFENGGQQTPQISAPTNLRIR